MLLRYFETLREYRVPISTREMLDLLELMRQRLIFADLGEFYFLSRMALVKDEQFYDRFDRAFADFFDGLDSLESIFSTAHSPELLDSMVARYFPESKRRRVPSNHRSLPKCSSSGVRHITV